VTNRPKQIGTRGETAVVRALRRLGYPGAERRALAGSNDLGDILICPGVIGEVKWGKHAKAASLADIAEWWKQTERERFNAGAAFGLLIIQRNGYGDERADKSRCFMDLGQLWGRDHQIVELVLDQATEILRKEGWGDPCTTQPTQ
jgi:hypothetical protein